jgi:hypothetical protein
MMIKKVMALLLAGVACSCSNNDDNTDNSVRKYADQVIVTQDGTSTTTKIEYNDDMQVTAYVSNRDTIRFEYEDGRLARVKEGNGIDPYTLEYTNGKLSGIYHYSQYYPVTYNSQEKSYTFEGGNLAFGLAGKDILYVDHPESYRESFTYDATKKGAFYNLDGEDIFPVTLFATFQYYYLTADALTSITLSGSEIANYLSENTYDDEGYILSSIMRLNGGEAFRVQYHYMEK